ncbi:ATPase [Candidatus Peribacteria bacterium]|jgi:uncharacterized protein|nr:ATPase [Candidatus Peribacteria bacterium]MBT4021564.1 ATPase [Candidatus Peribacteria bacterium]MBT4240582.1 ATPase [Candidatus Peribacteria bacterium]MBT4474683.1 ATPase [Candidatus Peribacteria bacterium]
MDNCHTSDDQHHMEPSSNSEASCHTSKGKKKLEIFLWVNIIILIIGYVLYAFFPNITASNTLLFTFTENISSLLNQMKWGIIIGIVFVGILEKIPREFVMSILGKGGTITGILRATAAGVLLDLCSHGILMVGAKLYERGASLGQVTAFLIASPWNSFSLTLILWALVGFKWMILMLLFSMAIAIVSGIIFDNLVKKKVLPENPNSTYIASDFLFWKEAKQKIIRIRPTPKFLFHIGWDGLMGSKMILKWIFFGVILASLVRTFIPPDAFATYFGPSIAGLALTVLVATILEVCSEGTLPVAADILTRAAAPGNAFAFLMTGVSTDYTEILILKETTKSWKIPFFLPLITVPQVLIIAWIMNQSISI